MKGKTLAAALAAGAIFVAAASAAEIALPDQISWTAYDTGSAGYNQAVAVGSALKNELGIDLRVLPGKTAGGP
jgi:hypothetical protein